MKIVTGLALIAMLTWGCGDSGNKKEKEKDTKVSDDGPKKELELPDSLFKLKDQKITFRMQSFDFEETFKQMNSIQKMKLLGGIPPFNNGKSNVCYFVSYQNKVQNIRPIIVYGSTENYSALILLNLNESNKVISYKEIAGGFCAAPVQYDDRIQWCDDKVSTIINDSMLVLYHLHLYSPSYERVNEKFIDSVKYLFRINPTGQLEELKKDSTRYFRVDRK